MLACCSPSLWSPERYQGLVESSEGVIPSEMETAVCIPRDEVARFSWPVRRIAGARSAVQKCPLTGDTDVLGANHFAHPSISSMLQRTPCELCTLLRV